MDYLLIKLLPYILLTGAFGMFVGFYSCSKSRD